MLHVAVAGAGIGGLSAALALAQAGCRVTAFERAPAMAEVGAGLQLSPNATAALRRLGVLARVERDAVAPDALCIGRGRDGKILARLPLGSYAEGRFGAPFLVTLRADLHRALLDEVRRSPSIEVETGRSLAGWTHIGRSLSLDFGCAATSVQVEALVGCDGLHSTVRAKLGIGPQARPRKGRRTAWRATIAAEAVPAVFREPNSNLWLGPKAHLVHYPVASGRLINVVATVDETEARQGSEDFWSQSGDPAEIQHRFEGWADPIRQLLATAETWSKWPLLDRPPLPSWSRGPVTLLGDAAHPMLPFLAQGAAQAIEDAAALGAAVLNHPLDPARAFLAYEAARLGRTARVQAESRRQAAIYHRSAPASLLRDMVLRAMPPRRLLARYDWLYRT